MRFTETDHRSSGIEDFDQSIHKFEEHMFQDIAFKYNISHFSKCK